MKIRTKEELVDFLDKEISWRKKELATLKANVDASRPKLEATAIRSAIVLLYAHWEGFIKRAAEAYLTYVITRKLKYSQLSFSFVGIALKGKLNELQQTQKATIYSQIVDHLYTCLDDVAVINKDKVIRTKSNLNSELFKEVLTAVGIDFDKYDTKCNLIDEQLLNYRNNIAHGNFVPLDCKEYGEIHLEVNNMLDAVKTDVENAALTSKYLR